MAVTAVTKDTFKQEVLDHKGVVFVDFHAEWCAPCKITEPIIKTLSEEIRDVKFVAVDVDQNPDVASQYSIFSIPTFLVIKDGAVANQLVGAAGRENFISEIKKVTG